jgi:3-oxoacyl-[acyl-carrier-protein] synthase-3
MFPMNAVPVFISGIGQALGPRILTNAELSSLTGFDETAIFELTGIRTRSFSPFEDEVDLAVRAAEDLFAKMGDQKSPDLLLLATTTPSSHVPSTAMKVQGRLFPHDSSPRFPGMDIGGSCAAFLTGLFVARAQIASGGAKEILLINTERKTRHVCPVHSPETALLFGDAATAVWISSSENFRRKGRTGHAPLRVRTVRIGASGERAGLITYSQDPLTRRKILRMEGAPLFRKAVRTLSEEIERMLLENSLPPGAIEAFILHQANGRILEGVAQRIGASSRQIPRTIDIHGNTSSASLGITLSHFLADKGPDALSGPLVLGAIGGGITWGVALLAGP